MLYFFSFCRASFKKNAEFRWRCNGFFVDMLSTVCFKDNTPPAPGVITLLLSYVKVETGTTYCIASCPGNIVPSLFSTPYFLMNLDFFQLWQFFFLQTFLLLGTFYTGFYIWKLVFSTDVPGWSQRIGFGASRCISAKIWPNKFQSPTVMNLLSLLSY